ncbi:hypothetical protein KFK09_013548 [Dendrobium nobile]|uniref:Uncharacterized protein n=1 Tax=Dendrobium nobile TaxID=94219 RepID=A0A8T3B7N6_DENNO|nr:hypothetical protein KFK09_013548 [Dendrobium nobile]
MDPGWPAEEGMVVAGGWPDGVARGRARAGRRDGVLGWSTGGWPVVWLGVAARIQGGKKIAILLGNNMPRLHLDFPHHLITKIMKKTA